MPTTTRLPGSDLLDAVIDVSRRAGREILDVYGTNFEARAKADNSPLTEADLRAHRLIVAALSALQPRLPVLSEESSEILYSERSGWERYWLVDPLDGTKEFVSRNGEFTVNIALIRGHAPVLGVVHAPALQRDYYGHVGGGAFRADGDGGGRPIHVQSPAQSPLRVVGSRSHAGGSLDRLLGRLGEHTLVPMGSSLKFCLVAEGAADFYPRLGPTSEWDTAAAQAVVEAAGGAVLDLQGGPLRYNTRREVLNPFFIVLGDQRRDWLALLRE